MFTQRLKTNTRYGNLGSCNRLMCSCMFSSKGCDLRVTVTSHLSACSMLFQQYESGQEKVDFGRNISIKSVTKATVEAVTHHNRTVQITFFFVVVVDEIC